MRTLDKTRDYATHVGPGMGRARYSQDGYDFDAFGQEVAMTDVEEKGGENKPIPKYSPEALQCHWRDLKKMYEAEKGAGSWDSLPSASRQHDARTFLSSLPK